ncbi:hypothetical protein AXZ07_13380 [Pseudomonas mosselii]|nr:hypothetical protein AXZ07_13380 [Pseudomonas mosselii]
MAVDFGTDLKHQCRGYFWSCPEELAPIIHAKRFQPFMDTFFRQFPITYRIGAIHKKWRGYTRCAVIDALCTGDRRIGRLTDFHYIGPKCRIL